MVNMVELEQPTSAPEQAERQIEGVFIDARQVLDPYGVLRDYAHTRANERLAGQGIDTLYKDFMSKTDVLGAARIVCAAKEQGLPSKTYQDNLAREVTTTLIEAVQADGHVATTRIDVNGDGRAHLGQIMFDEMVLRGLHPEHAPIFNKYGEIDFYSELMSQAHFRNPHLRQSHARVTLSLIPSDEVGDMQVLDDYFNLGTGGWMIDWMHFEPKRGGGWERVTQRMFMSGSDPRVANSLLQTLGITDAPLYLTAAGVRETSILVSRAEFAQGPVGIGRMADAIVSDAIDRPVFCGKPRNWQPTDEHYAALPAESARREAEIKNHVRQLTILAERLAGNGEHFTNQNQHFANAIIWTLRDICKNQPEYAEHVFGMQAMALYQKSKDQRQAGDASGADASLKDAYNLSKTAFICDIEIAITDVAHAEISPYASLEEKYGYNKVHTGTCVACGTKSKLGPCDFCNDCDTQERLEPGYIKELQQKRANAKKTGTILRMLLSGEWGEHKAKLHSKGSGRTSLVRSFIHTTTP